MTTSTTRSAPSAAQALLRETLETTLATDDTFPKRFYELLFAAHPEVSALFKSHSPGAQRKMFALKLVAIVDHIDNPAWLERELGAMARSHAGYGVTAPMYAWVGDALIATLREACGEAWSDAAEQAWRDAYASLATAMQR
jgi:hemoglobin-like flavoprotein